MYKKVNTAHIVELNGKDSEQNEIHKTIIFMTPPRDLPKTLKELYNLDDDFKFTNIETKFVDILDEVKNLIN